MSRTSHLALAIAGALTLYVASSNHASAGSVCDLTPPAGTPSTATGANALACGNGNTANGNDAIAIGGDNTVNTNLGTAIGRANLVDGQGSTALGVGNQVGGTSSIVVGNLNSVTSNSSAVFGSNNQVSSASSPYGSTVYGSNNTVTEPSSVYGNYNTAAGGFVVGDGNTVGMLGTAFGHFNFVTGDNSTAVGENNSVSGQSSMGIGNHTNVSADYSVALGAGSTNDRDNTISVGAVGAERQIINVAAGTQDHDAVNLSQLYPLMNALGGGANFSGGIFTPPNYIIQGASFNNAGSTFAAIDQQITGLKTSISNLELPPGPQGPTGPQGPAGPQGPEGPAGGTADPNAIAYDDNSQGQLTLGGANGTRVSNVANGTAATDAVNLSQLQQGNAATLTSANTYTDQKVATLSLDFTNYRAEVDDRFELQDSRIDKVGAMSAAMANMTASAAGVRATNRVAIGVGNYRGENALAFGYQRAISDKTVITFGGAINGDDSSVGAGAAFGW